MKIIGLFALIIAIGFIMATGCVAQIKKDPGNATVTPTVTFTSFANVTTAPVVTITNSTNTTNGTNVTNSTPKLKGPLRVSISGYPVDLPVTVDNETVGIVSKEKPLDITVDEGVHTVKTCVGTFCEQENVTITFAKKTYVDFGERLRRDIEFPEPTARILEYFKNGGGVSVNIEFINPTQEPITLAVEVSVGYDFIDDRTNIKMGDSAKGKLVQYVDPGQRVTNRLDLYFASGHSYNFDVPQITSITTQ
jgi:hypothetical protein